MDSNRFTACTNPNIFQDPFCVLVFFITKQKKSYNALSVFRSARMGSRAPHRDCLSSALWIRPLTPRLLRCATLQLRTSSRPTSLLRIRKRRSPTRRLRIRDTRTWPTPTSPSAPCISTSRPPGIPHGAATRRMRESYHSHTARWASSPGVNTPVFLGSCTRSVRVEAREWERWEMRRSACTRLSTVPRICRQVLTLHLQEN